MFKQLLTEKFSFENYREYTLKLPKTIKASQGPMFEKYNAALRGGALAPNANQPAFMQTNFEKHCKGNRYPTTLHLISSGIMKLGKLTTVGYGVDINSFNGPWGFSFQVWR